MVDMKNQSAFEWWDNLPETSLDKPNKYGLAMLFNTEPKHILMWQIKSLYKIEKGSKLFDKEAMGLVFETDHKVEFTPIDGNDFENMKVKLRPKSKPIIPEPPKCRKIIEGKQPDPPKPKQFRVYKSNFGWMVSEVRKKVKKRFLRSDVVTWDYEVLNMIGKYKNPLSCSHTPFRTKDEAIEWLKEIIKGRKEPPTASLYSYDIEYFNESDLI